MEVDIACEITRRIGIGNIAGQHLRTLRIKTQGLRLDAEQGVRGDGHCKLRGSSSAELMQLLCLAWVARWSALKTALQRGFHTTAATNCRPWRQSCRARSDEHTSDLQSLMHISYAVFSVDNKSQNTILTTL